MRFISAILLLISITSCTTLTESQRFHSQLSAKEFNSVSSKYMDRPTFLSISNFSDNTSSLTVLMDLYGQGQSGLFLDKARSQQYIDAIDKYLAWENKAKTRGDMFTKEISTIKAGGSMTDLKYKFTFHSGNQNQHYLSIIYCTAVMCIDKVTQYYDVANAKELKELLLQFKQDSIKVNDIDSEYN